MKKLFKPTSSVTQDDGKTLITINQTLTDEFLENNRKKRDASASNPMGDYHEIADIPRAHYLKWCAMGIDLEEMTPKEIVDLLKMEGNEHFITTKRSL